MFYQFLKNTVFILLPLLFSYSGLIQKQRTENSKDSEITHITKKDSIIVGANQMEEYLPLLNGKKVGFIGNQTSVIFHQKGYTHLVDSLVARGVIIKRVF